MKKGREQHTSNVSLNNKFFTHIRAIATLLCIPALLHNGCSPDADPAMPKRVSAEEAQGGRSGTTIRVAAAGSEDDLITDIFIFNDDRLRRIDSYQRVTGTEVKAASRNGDKILVAIANPHRDRDSWRSIGSYEGLREASAMLSADDPDNPVMTGEARLRAGSGGHCEVEITRLMSQICIRTLRADFLGTEYENEDLTDARVYLTNVNAECGFLKTDGFSPEQIVNFGALDETAAGKFSRKEMIVQDIGKVSAKGVPDPIRLFCYPCDHTTETPGSPFTRLVIEGKIRGHLYYYPITINRDGAGGGISRNCIYTYDITLNRSGSSDPDIPVSPEAVTINARTVPWQEKDEDTVTF